MIHYFILPLPFLLYFSRLLFTNYLIPSRKKKHLYETLAQRADWPTLSKTEQFLRLLFKGERTNITAMIGRRLNRIKNKELTYGEIDFLSFHRLIEKTDPKPDEIFYDLGSGAGKAVFTAALFFDLSKSCGIELLRPLYQKANHQIQKATLMIQSGHPICEWIDSKKIFKIQFVHGDFFQRPFHDANIIYVAATCLHESTWVKLIQKMAQLTPGTRIIVATKTIEHERFEKIYEGVELMSWGLCVARIYKIKPFVN